MPKVYTADEARDKNKTEYNDTAADYDAWCQKSVLMQQVCYYSTFNELEKDGIEGKTFLEVGCGPCPMGQRLVQRGAKKVYSLDISSEMIETARNILTEKGIIDKFELICADILDENFVLPEKVDCIVASYAITTFINEYSMLTKILDNCRKSLKPDGMMFLCEFSYVEQPCNDFFYEMYTAPVVANTPPVPFEPFNFFIDSAPDYAFEIFHIPANTMLRRAWRLVSKPARTSCSILTRSTSTTRSSARTSTTAARRTTLCA
jgi:ubiquinone/menaquinone biosynthesis C-methylase UbiE